MTAKEQWYRISIHTQKIRDETPKGFGYEFGGPGWGGRRIPTPHWQRDLRSTMVIIEDRAYVSVEILKYLMDTTALTSSHLKIGSRRMFLVTERILDKAIEYNSYPDRTQNQRRVTNRNSSLIEWLINFT